MTTTRNLAQTITRMVATEVRYAFGNQHAMQVLFCQLEDDFKKALKDESTMPVTMTRGHMFQRWQEQCNNMATTVKNNILDEVHALVSEEVNNGGLER